MEPIQPFKEYLRLQRYGPKTEAQYTKAAERYFRHYGDVTQETINDFLTYKVVNNTLNRAFIKALCSAFKKEDLEITVPRMRKGEKIYNFLTKDQIDYIIKYALPKTSLLTRLMFETGLRLFELVDLPREGINLEEKYLEGVGKGNKPFRERFSEKSRIGLIEYLNQELPDIDYPFHYKDIKHHCKKFWYDLKNECEKMGIKNAHPHIIRHSLGRHLRMVERFDAEQVRVKLRHTKLETTKIYFTATREEVDRKMEEMFSKEAMS